MLGDHKYINEDSQIILEFFDKKKISFKKISTQKENKIKGLT